MHEELPWCRCRDGIVYHNRLMYSVNEGMINPILPRVHGRLGRATKRKSRGEAGREQAVTMQVMESGWDMDLEVGGGRCADVRGG